MTKPTSFPHTIEIGNGPSVVVHSQAEYDAFVAAARSNAAALNGRRDADHEDGLEVHIKASGPLSPEDESIIAGLFDAAQGEHADSSDVTLTKGQAENAAQAVAALVTISRLGRRRGAEWCVVTAAHALTVGDLPSAADEALRWPSRVDRDDERDEVANAIDICVKAGLHVLSAHEYDLPKAGDDV